MFQKFTSSYQECSLSSLFKAGVFDKAQSIKASIIKYCLVFLLPWMPTLLSGLSITFLTTSVQKIPASSPVDSQNSSFWLFNRCSKKQGPSSKWPSNIKLNKVKRNLRHVLKWFKLFLFVWAMRYVSFYKRVEEIIFLRLIFWRSICFRGHFSELMLNWALRSQPFPFI